MSIDIVPVVERAVQVQKSNKAGASIVTVHHTISRLTVVDHESVTSAACTSIPISPAINIVVRIADVLSSFFITFLVN
jgi:hypothetical protein